MHFFFCYSSVRSISFPYNYSQTGKNKKKQKHTVFLKASTYDWRKVQDGIESGDSFIYLFMLTQSEQFRNKNNALDSGNRIDPDTSEWKFPSSVNNGKPKPDFIQIFSGILIF